MPLYENECTKCGATDTYVRKIDERHDTPACAKCGAPTKQIISAVRGFADTPEYRSPVTGKVIRGRRQRRYDLESNGCRPYEGTEVEVREAKRIRAERDKKIDAQIDEKIHETIGELESSNKLERVGDRSDALPDISNMRVY